MSVARARVDAVATGEEGILMHFPHRLGQTLAVLTVVFLGVSTPGFTAVSLLAAQENVDRFETMEVSWWLPLAPRANPFDQSGELLSAEVTHESGLGYLWPLFATGEVREGEGRFVAHVEDDRLSWDHAWAEGLAAFVEQIAERGYVQLNIFDTWGRKLDSKLEWDTESFSQVLDPWSERFLDQKQSYLGDLGARFGGYANVFWELGNEMGNAPNCRSCFAELANEYYLPWLRSLDAHGRPVALSESVWQLTDVDIALLHQAYERPEAAWRKPVIMNESVFGASRDSWWHVLLQGPTIWSRRSRTPPCGTWS